MDSKRIVCLANSRKINGYCVAGKELTSRNWIRPIGRSPTGELTVSDQQYPDNTYPKLLDVMRVPLLHHEPHGCQKENYLIDDGYYWKKEGRFNWSDLKELEDSVDGERWANGYHSYNGINDRIPEGFTNALPNSLMLIQPESIAITVGLEGMGYSKPKVRAKFELAGIQYHIVVTDPLVEKCFKQKRNGVYPLEAKEIYMCLSIGEPFNGYCYKLVASIICQPK